MKDTEDLRGLMGKYALMQKNRLKGRERVEEGGEGGDHVCLQLS